MALLDGETVEAPPPTVEMMVKPTALVVVMISPAVRDMEFRVVLGTLDAEGVAEELAPAAEADTTDEETGTPFDVVLTRGVVFGLVEASVVESGDSVEPSDIGGIGVTAWVDV